MSIREATEGDLKAIALLAAQKRKPYEKYQPVFHKEGRFRMARKRHSMKLWDLRISR